MEILDKLNETVEKIIEIANNINDETNAEIWNKAPLIIHHRFCSKYVELLKEHPNKKPEELPKAMDVLTAIEVLQELYPELIEI